MTLTLPDSPPDGFELVRRNVRFFGQGFDDLDGEAVMIAPPQPIYTATAKNVLDGNPLASAKFTGWQYIIVADDAAKAVAEVSAPTPQSSQLAYASLQFAAYAKQVADAIGQAESLAQTHQGNFELRMFRAPGLDYTAVWLHGPEDLLLSIDPAPSHFDEVANHSESAVVTALTPMATVRIENSDRITPAQLRRLSLAKRLGRSESAGDAAKNEQRQDVGERQEKVKRKPAR